MASEPMNNDVHPVMIFNPRPFTGIVGCGDDVHFVAISYQTTSQSLSKPGGAINVRGKSIAG
jgi:hypothetical protein